MYAPGSWLGGCRDAGRMRVRAARPAGDARREGRFLHHSHRGREIPGLPWMGRGRRGIVSGCEFASDGGTCNGTQGRGHRGPVRRTDARVGAHAGRGARDVRALWLRRDRDAGDGAGLDLRPRHRRVNGRGAQGDVPRVLGCPARAHLRGGRRAGAQAQAAPGHAPGGHGGRGARRGREQLRAAGRRAGQALVRRADVSRRAPAEGASAPVPPGGHRVAGRARPGGRRRVHHHPHGLLQAPGHRARAPAPGHQQHGRRRVPAGLSREGAPVHPRPRRRDV